MTLVAEAAAPSDQTPQKQWGDKGYRFGLHFSPSEDAMVVGMALGEFGSELGKIYSPDIVASTAQTAQERRSEVITASQPRTNELILSDEPPKPITSNKSEGLPQVAPSMGDFDGFFDSKMYSARPPKIETRDLEALARVRDEIGRQAERGVSAFDSDQTVVAHSALNMLASDHRAARTLDGLRLHLPPTDARMISAVERAKRETDLRKLANSILAREVIPRFDGEEDRKKALQASREKKLEGKTESRLDHTRPLPAIEVINRVDQSGPMLTKAVPESEWLAAVKERSEQFTHDPLTASTSPDMFAGRPVARQPAPDTLVDLTELPQTQQRTGHRGNHKPTRRITLKSLTRPNGRHESRSAGIRQTIDRHRNRPKSRH